jgi:hypothetical protein
MSDEGKPIGSNSSGVDRSMLYDVFILFLIDAELLDREPNFW